jgi:GDP-4-dehydro-6-deoxy-D-mannose reductase
MTIRRVFITGVTGFAGQHLARHCLEADDRVTGLKRDRTKSALPSELSREVNTVSADLRDKKRLSSAVESANPTHVFHLAGLSHVPHSIEKPRKTYQVNFTGSLNLLEVLNEHGLSPDILMVGSAAQYGRTAREHDRLTEQHPLRPTSPYGVSKTAMESLACDWRHRRGWDLVTTRSFPHTGPGQRPSFVCPSFARQVARVEAGERDQVEVGNTGVVRDFCDVRDVVEAYRKLLMTNEVQPDVYNVCSGNGRSIQSVLETLIDYSTVNVSVRSTVDRERSQDLNRLVGDPTKLRNAIDWTPSFDFTDTIRDLLDYWRDRISG